MSRREFKTDCMLIARTTTNNTNSTMKNTLQIIAFVFALLIAGSSFAQAPKTISYQGYLVDGSNQPVTGNHTITVKLYDVSSGGAALHTESFTMNVMGGNFSAIIGSQTAIASNVTFDKQYWLSISVDGGAEMTPRTQLTGAPYAMMAKVAESLAPNAAVTSLNTLTGDVTIEGTGNANVTKVGNKITIDVTGGGAAGVTNVNGQQGALTFQGGGGTTVSNVGNVFTISSSGGGGGTGIQGVQSTDGSLAITNANGPTATVNIAKGGVNSDAIEDGAVITDKLATKSVTSAKIADAAVGTTQIADNGITSSKIAANAVGYVQIAGKAVGTASINDGAVQTLQLSDGAVTSAKIADGTIATGDIADNAVATAKIANNAVTLGKISTTGAANGNVLTYNGSAIVWGTGATGISTLTNGDGMITINNPTGPTSTLNLTNNSIDNTKLKSEFASLTKVSGGLLTGASGNITSTGHLNFSSDGTSIIFPAADAINEPMIYLFNAGTSNGDRMIFAHSPSHKNWGIQYSDANDELKFLSNGNVLVNMHLGSNLVGIGNASPSAKLDVVATTNTNAGKFYLNKSDATVDALHTETNGTGAALYANQTNGSATLIAKFASSGTTQVNIEKTGNINTKSLTAVTTTDTAIIATSTGNNTQPTVYIKNTNANNNALALAINNGSFNMITAARNGDMFTYGKIEAMDGLISDEALASGATPVSGGVYWNNVCYAWGHVGSAGGLTSGFGMTVTRTAVGIYNITYKKTLDAGRSPVATALEASSPQFAVISATSDTGCTVKIWKFNAGTFSLVDSDFFIHVMGAPQQF